MLKSARGSSLVEWVVCVVIVVGVVGTAIYGVFVTLGVKFNELNTEIQ